MLKNCKIYAIILIGSEDGVWLFFQCFPAIESRSLITCEANGGAGMGISNTAEDIKRLVWEFERLEMEREYEKNRLYDLESESGYINGRLYELEMREEVKLFKELKVESERLVNVKKESEQRISQLESEIVRLKQEVEGLIDLKNNK